MILLAGLFSEVHVHSFNITSRMLIVQLVQILSVDPSALDRRFRELSILYSRMRDQPSSTRSFMKPVLHNPVDLLILSTHQSYRYFAPRMKLRQLPAVA